MWHKICLVSELDPLMGRYAEIGDRQVAIFLLEDGSIHAVDNLCPHQTGPLCRGDVQSGKVLCPWHGWEFELATGQCTHIPNTKVEVFETKVEDDHIFVKMRSSQ